MRPEPLAAPDEVGAEDRAGRSRRKRQGLTSARNMGSSLAWVSAHSSSGSEPIDDARSGEQGARLPRSSAHRNATANSRRRARRPITGAASDPVEASSSRIARNAVARGAPPTAGVGAARARGRSALDASRHAAADRRGEDASAAVSLTASGAPTHERVAVLVEGADHRVDDESVLGPLLRDASSEATAAAVGRRARAAWHRARHRSRPRRPRRAAAPTAPGSRPRTI